MPLYEYQCKICKNTFELRQKFSDPPASACPVCDGEVKKLISQSDFALKGKGWYDDGYGNTKPASSASAPAACPSGGSCSGCPSAS